MQVALVDRAELVLHHPDADEQGGLDQPVGQQVEERAGQAVRLQQSDAGQGEPDVADRREREQPGQVLLEVAHQRAEQGGQGGGAEEHAAQAGGMRAEHPGEGRPVDPHGRVQPEF